MCVHAASVGVLCRHGHAHARGAQPTHIILLHYISFLICKIVSIAVLIMYSVSKKIKVEHTCTLVNNFKSTSTTLVLKVLVHYNVTWGASLECDRWASIDFRAILK